ncbi:3-chlorobenzoate-3,4-dioxygenase reductase subunit [Thalictrum thalictroides]|uniref:3-chlorobenzoate-3,4-dioxygenase reductase subunit n=1 Tax=Thalictrum thalictroides TaxID=46969 RepID=A0A7J6VK23_THATH|nr:3-chlorobenzoate-3,4-dioxygenase reductase subunit [Thalictrum thalictroides]
MAVTEFYQNMHDIRLKPRLLRSLTKNHLPDENHPFPSPSELSTVVTAIKTHGLLSESVYGDSVDQKFVDKWKSAVDAWVERLLLLVSSKMPDKCWAGTCLLGVTFEECSNARFLASYSTWFSKLLPQIQQPTESQLVKVASCASLSDMLTRLSGILIVKKDGLSLAGKLIQPILNLLNEDGSESVWEGAVDLFCTLMNLFPSSVHRHYDSVEAAIVSKIMSGKCNSNLSKKFAYCLALLPKTRGDEDSWLLMMQKILIFINMQLNDAFQFLKEETRSSEALEFLVPLGKKPPPPLGGQESAEASYHAVQRSEQLLFCRVSTLMQCCSMMLTNPYPVQVSVPVRPLLALVRRVLLVDGSSQQALRPLMTVAQQENICSELPSLHLCSLEVLTAVIKGIRSQLLPNAVEVVRIVTEYFRRCMLPALRIKVYSIVKILLISMGVGVALYLAQEVINHAFVDLDFYNHGSTTSSNKYSIHATYALQQPSNTKRKHATLTEVASDHQNGIGVEPRSKPATPISVQIASLQTLEALLTVGGALRSESWRSKVDFLLINIASNTCEGGWANEERTDSVVSGEFSSTWADFQLAALRALLASLLSPARCRPQYLGRSLDLFRRGKQETGTKLAEFCAHALLALEVLIHPRALPLANLSLNNCNGFDEGFNPKFPEKPFSSSQEQNTPFSRGVLGIDEPDPDDDLYESWLGNGEEVAAPISNVDENMEQTDKPSNAEPLNEKLAYDGSVGTLFLDEGRFNEPTGNVNVETGRYADDVMVSIEKPQVPVAFSKVGTSDKGVMIPCGQSGSSAIESITSVINRNALEDSNEGAIPSRSEEAAFSKGTISVIDGLPPPDKLVVASSTLLLDKGKQFMSGNDSDDSFPDIIDADPDSDSD